MQLNVAVTDNKGNYVTGLKPTDFVISEDGISEKISTFEEGNGPTLRLLGGPPAKAPGDSPNSSDDPNKHSPTRSPARTSSSSSTPATTCIAASFSRRTPSLILSVRSKPPTKSRSIPTVAICSAPRRSPPTAPKSSRGVRTTVAGDDAALYNSLLLTLKDAATQVGRKVVVVFSNGPDNASMVPPEDVAELAQSPASRFT